MPYEKWECISKKCTKHLENSMNKDQFYSQNTICNSNLKIGEDFIFAYDNRTSFAVELGLFCEGEAQMSFLSSSIFLGIIGHNMLSSYTTLPFLFSSECSSSTASNWNIHNIFLKCKTHKSITAQRTLIHYFYSLP